MRRSRHPSDYDNLASWLFERSRLKTGAVWADRVVAVSSFTERNLVEAGVDADQITRVSPHIPGVEHWSPTEGETDRLRERLDLGDVPVVVTVSRLVERKGVDTVLEALHRHRDELPELRYVVAGDGPDRERLETEAEELELGDIVRFAGFVDEDTKHHLYELASVFVMPNRELADGDVEGFGIVFLEANAHGTPVVGGRSGGAVDAVRDGETGFLVDPRDPDALAARLGELLRDEDLRARLGEQGRARVEEELDFEANLDRLEADLQAGLEGES